MKTQYEFYYQDKECQELRFDIYGYSPPTYYRNRNGERILLQEDYRTVKRYQEYMDAGFTILLGQMSSVYSGEEWETSNAKLVLDNAYEAGLKKVILQEDRLHKLSRTPNGIIGEDKPFKTEAELDAYVEECIKPYRDHPALYGLQLCDEPSYKCFEALGQIRKSILRVRPGTIVQCNLLPMITLVATHFAYPPNGSLTDRYKRYLEQFIEVAGFDYIQYDGYPFMHRNPNGIHRLYMRSLQIAAQVCKEKNVPFYFVAQSTGWIVNGEEAARKPNEEEIRWQMNLLLGFGVKQLAYFTYWTKGDADTAGEYFYDGSAMLTREGEKTPLWYYVQAANAEMQKLAPVILNFDYEKDAYFLAGGMRSHPWYTELMDWQKIDNLVSCETDQEVVHIVEMYDKKHEKVMYKIQNVTDPYYDDFYPDKQKTTVQFATEYTKADVFEDGQWKTVDMDKGKYTVQLRAGHAQFILPYKK